MADEQTIYRECVTLHYWGGLGNGVGLLAKVDFYDSQTCIRWLPQSKEGSAIALTSDTLKRLAAEVDKDRSRVGSLLSPNLSDESEEE